MFVYSKWFLQALGPQDLHKMLDAFEDKTAYAVATFAYSAGPGQEPILFQGKTEVRGTLLSFSASSSILIVIYRVNLYHQEVRLILVSPVATHLQYLG